jgi:anaerobic magnesium-protoporphyrin IX monomethyl ester cyclase
MEKYLPLPNQYKRKPVIHMIVIRGCPYSCAFCSNNAIFGRKIRSRSPESVVEEIEFVKKKYGAKEISFWDDMLTVNKNWIYRFCELLTENKTNVTWTCLARVDSVNKEMLAKMAKAGCWNIFYGFEAGSQMLLDNINKGITLDQIRNAVKWTKEARIEIRGSFMLALPGETPELAEKTIAFAKELNPDYAQFSITTPYPGTRLYDDAEKWGKLTKNFSVYHGWDAVFIPYGYKNKKQILELEKKAVRSFYFRPAFIFNTIKNIRSWEDLKRYYKGLRFLLGFM